MLRAAMSTPSTATTRYVIRTKSGDKGPFSPEDIKRLVDQSRLPPQTRILDIDAKRAVTAAEAVIIAAANASAAAAPASPSAETEVLPAPEPAARRASRSPSAEALAAVKPITVSIPAPSAADGTHLPQTVEASTYDGALERVDGDAETPKAPGTRIPAPRTGRTGRGGRGRTTVTTVRKGARDRKRTGAASETNDFSVRPSPLRRRLVIAGIAFGVVLIAGIAAALWWMKQDRFVGQAERLLASTLAKPEALAVGGEPSLLRVLIRRDHAAALAAARLERGTFEGYKPAVDEKRYAEELRVAIAAQLATPDAALLTDCAWELVSATEAPPADVALAQDLAQRAVTMEQEKGWRSLLVLGWTLFKSGDSRRAALIAEQAMALAPGGEAKSECGTALAKFKRAK